MTTNKPKIKFSKGFLTVNGKRCGVYYSHSCWISGVNPDTIKVRPKKYSFPDGFTEAFEIENNSDMMTDYFEKDSLRLIPGDSLYQAAKDACGA